jgi:hypothetical protein
MIVILIPGVFTQIKSHLLINAILESTLLLYGLGISKRRSIRALPKATTSEISSNSGDQTFCEPSLRRQSLNLYFNLRALLLMQYPRRLFK